jgi:hypothetical protein
VTAFIGIDPGLTGAVGVLNADGTFRTLFDLPVIRDRSLAWIDGDALLSALLAAKGSDAATVIVERVSAMPGQGVASSFGFGVMFGSILATVQCLRLLLEFVTPATWKRALGLSSDKRAALDKAQLPFAFVDLSLARSPLFFSEVVEPTGECHSRAADEPRRCI